MRFEFSLKFGISKEENSSSALRNISKPIFFLGIAHDSHHSHPSKRISK
jgi:hypothetical protein